MRRKGIILMKELNLIDADLSSEFTTFTKIVRHK